MSEKLIKNDSIVDTKIDNEVVMMNAQLGHYFGLDDIGTVIWELLDEPMTEQELVQKLTLQFNISTEQCEKDIKPFINGLLRNGMLTKSAS